MVCDPVDKRAEVLAKLTGCANEGEGCEITEMPAPFSVVGKAPFPHLAKVCVNLPCLVHSGIDYSYAE